MPENPVASSSTNRRRILAWGIILACILIVLYWYEKSICQYAPLSRQHITFNAIPDTPPSFLLYLPDQAEPMPNTEELAAINTITTKWQEQDKAGWIAVISPATLRALYAKIILHSHSIGTNHIFALPDINRISWKNSDTIYIGAATPKSITDKLKKKGTLTAQLPTVPFVRQSAPNRIETAAIVLGNQPLDASTPTIDLVKRTLKGVEMYARNPNMLLVFSGGATTGEISEARMMALIAESRGVPPSGYRLEEEAFSTDQNAIYTRKLLNPMHIKKIFIISKKSHLDDALPAFRAQEGMAKAIPVTVDITREESIRQMQEYLSTRKDPIVEGRLKLLELGEHGID